MSTTYNLAGITEQDCDMIAAALDFYLCNAEIPEEQMEALTEWLCEFDLMADPLEFEESLGINDSNDLPAEPRITNISGNLISVDFSNKNV